MDTLKSQLDAMRPLTADQVLAIRRSFRGEDIEFVYASNAIEGSRLTLRETQVVIEHGVRVAGKPLQDHIDARNGALAVALMREIVESGTPIGTNEILALHSRVLGADDSRAGRIRTFSVTIAGSHHVPPAWPQVSDAFDGMVDEYQVRRNVEHPVVVGADLHHQFVNIHPFAEGNGRTGRLILNAHLMQYGYAPIIIQPEDRLAYYDALAAADGGDRVAFRSFIVEREAATLARYLTAITVRPRLR